jgi:nucleoside-diphosphate-sugar epimerase
MRILVLGGAGMVGRKFIQRIAKEGSLAGRGIQSVTAQDVVMASPPAECAGPNPPFAFKAIASDLAAEGEAARLVAARPDLILHLAAIVSGEAEADFDKGYRVNLDGTRALFEAIRQEGKDGGQKAPYAPRVIFTSSIAVFGAPFPDKIGDEFHLTPLTSYGTQKAIGELLLADYTRRGFMDGVGIRLPTICVRPGAPNKAASGFFSNIIREPLAGHEAVLPVSEDVKHWHASPRAAVNFLIHAATMDTNAIGPRRNLSMPGFACTVGEQIAALRRIAGESVVKRIRREPDPVISAIVANWPRDFAPARAPALGFRAEASFDEIIRAHIEDELAGSFTP